MALELAIDARLLSIALVLLVAFLILYATFAGFKLVGITPGEVLAILFLAPFLAPINVPVWEMPGVVVGINAAGVFIPVVLSVRFLLQGRVNGLKVGAGIVVVTLAAYRVAEVDPARGVLVPAFWLVLVCAAVGLALAAGRWTEVGPITYASGAVGTLIGADLLNLGKLADETRTEPLYAVIGGAGTFDAIYLISLVAVVLSIVVVAIMRVLDPPG